MLSDCMQNNNLCFAALHLHPAWGDPRQGGRAAQLRGHLPERARRRPDRAAGRPRLPHQAHHVPTLREVRYQMNQIVSDKKIFTVSDEGAVRS